MKAFITKLIHREDGASALEYALLAAMVAVVIATFVTPIGDAIGVIFTSIQTALTPAP
ncbi:Flp family type IVb pilin [Methylomonas montana]|uniref:Flp family type IVb pilin n=1 Tax=Methylomonas montana TaxID=3058963 RepID=UPI0026580F15|nr:Flp family type IVb pilin [Methylomonas montana]WKJ90986.1 Flp family type IVb pilin [Methylomonas montana]